MAVGGRIRIQMSPLAQVLKHRVNGEVEARGAGPFLKAAEDAALDLTQRIPFNKPYIAGRELHYIAKAVAYENIGGDGFFTKAACSLMEQRFDIPSVQLVNSGTAAIEMAVMLCDVGPGDEVIMPSFTFVSCANAVVRAGGTPVFIDSRPDTMNMDETLIEAAITDRTKAIMPVHYAGVACEMAPIVAIAKKHGLRVIEDAAQGVNSLYDGQALGSIGDLGCYSFHDTKNFVCGEGGALTINDPDLIDRARILRDKGTNRHAFWAGKVDKYTWVDLGSSYVPSEIASAFLFAQLEMMDGLQDIRNAIWNRYDERLKEAEVTGLLTRPQVPMRATSNSHIYFVLLDSNQLRTDLIAHLAEQDIHAVFHFVPLHDSPMGEVVARTSGSMSVVEDTSHRLLRLPMYYDLDLHQVDRICDAVIGFLEERS